MKRLKTRAPCSLLPYLTLLGPGLYEQACTPDWPIRPDEALVSLQRDIPDHWMAEIEYLEAERGVSRTQIVVAGLQRAATSRGAVPERMPGDLPARMRHHWRWPWVDYLDAKYAVIIVPEEHTER